MRNFLMSVKVSPVIGVALGALLLSASTVGVGQAEDLPEGFAKGNWLLPLRRK